MVRAGNDVLETRSYAEIKAERHAQLDPVEQQTYIREKEEAELRMSVAEMVYEGRVRAGMSQSELASLAGTRQSVISAVENGAQIPQITTLMRIADALQCPLEVRIGQSGFVHNAVAS